MVTSTLLVRGGRLLDAKRHRADLADILIRGDTILVGRPASRARSTPSRSTRPAASCIPA